MIPVPAITLPETTSLGFSSAIFQPCFLAIEKIVEFLNQFHEVVVILFFGD